MAVADLARLPIGADDREIGLDMGNLAVAFAASVNLAHRGDLIARRIECQG